MTAKKTHIAALATVLAAMGMLVSPSFTDSAFAHAHLILTPDIENVNPILVTVGHTNEPTFGVKPGVHDGMHGLEVYLEDERTALPLTGAELAVDKYYFTDIGSFERASSLDGADQIERNITVGAVFGDPGHYLARQIVQPGIYGYHLYGTIDYFGVAEVPIEATIFCRAEDGGNSTSKFNSEGWSGSFGCVDDIDNLYFPDEPRLMGSADSTDKEELQQGALPGGSASASSAATDI